MNVIQFKCRYFIRFLWVWHFSFLRPEFPFSKVKLYNLYRARFKFKWGASNRIAKYRWTLLLTNCIKMTKYDNRSITIIFCDKTCSVTQINNLCKDTYMEMKASTKRVFGSSDTAGDDNHSVEVWLETNSLYTYWRACHSVSLSGAANQTFLP